MSFTTGTNLIERLNDLCTLCLRLILYLPRTVGSLLQNHPCRVAVLEPAQAEIHQQRYAAREQAARLAEAQQALSGNSVELQTERGRNRALLSEIEVVRAAQVE